MLSSKDANIKKKNQESILNKDDDIVNGHSDKFETDSCSNNMLDWIIAWELEQCWFCEEYHSKRDEAEDDFNAFEYFLS